MSTLRPNRYNVAVQKVQKLKGVNVPKEIKESEKDFFHILFIKSRPNMGTMDFTHNVKHQIINKETYARCKDTYAQLGYTNIVILHDPNDTEVEVKSTNKTGKSADAGATDTGKGSETKELEYEGLIVTEENVDTFAKDNSIDLKKAKTPAEKLTIVELWIEEKVFEQE